MVKTFLSVAAALEAIFGALFVAVPDIVMGLHGASLNAGGTLLGRVLGASLLAMALIFWSARSENYATRTPALQSGLIYNAIVVALGFQALASGVVNAMGWGLVGLHIVLLAGFTYFAVVDRR